ncbi:MAG: YggS family pyridoxal phosphate-dependent enzyme [Planctomycetota bacterium]
MADLARLRENLASVRGRIRAASRASGRSEDAVRHVAVTKTVDADAVRALYDLRERDFGESRAQEGVPKAEALGLPAVRWHFIGHLQRRKVKRVLPLFGAVHSLDSLLLAEEMDRTARQLERTVDVFIEVKTSEETGKTGLDPKLLPELVEAVSKMEGLCLQGLMTMAPFFEEPVKTRPYFARLRGLKDEVSRRTGVALPELSMGMTNDFEAAIAEGATVVRIGTALFQGVLG